MADNYQQFSEQIGNITKDEGIWLKAAITSGSKVHKALIKLLEKDDDDAIEYFPSFESEFQEEKEWDHTKGKYVPTGYKYFWIYDTESSDLNHVGLLVQEFLKKFRPTAYWSLTWAETCSKPRIGEFAGGAMFVTAQDILVETGGEWVGRQIESFVKKRKGGKTG